MTTLTNSFEDLSYRGCNSPVILNYILLCQTLQKPFVVRDYDKLEVGLLSAFPNDPSKEMSVMYEKSMWEQAYSAKDSANALIFS